MCTISLGGENVNILEIKDMEEDLPRTVKSLHKDTILYDYGDSFSTEVINIYIKNMTDFHEFIKSLTLSLSSSVFISKAMRSINISKFMHNLAVNLHEMIGLNNKDKEVRIFCLAKRADESFTISQDVEYVSVCGRALELMYEFESSGRTSRVDVYDENGNQITNLTNNRLSDMLVDVSFKSGSGKLYVISHKDNLQDINVSVEKNDENQTTNNDEDKTTEESTEQIFFTPISRKNDSDIKKLKHKVTEEKHVDIPSIEYHMLTLAEDSTDSKVLEAGCIMRSIMTVSSHANSMKLNIDKLYVSKSKILYIDFMALLDSNPKMKCGDVSNKYKALKEKFKFNNIDIRLIDTENNTNKIPLDMSFLKEDIDAYFKEQHMLCCIELLVAGLDKLR